MTTGDQNGSSYFFLQEEACRLCLKEIGKAIVSSEQWYHFPARQELHEVGANM